MSRASIRGSAMAILAVTIGLWLGFPPAHAASFDCNARNLKPDEKTICDNRALNDADVRMVTTFHMLTSLVAMGTRGDLQDEQREWLQRRQQCGADAACIKAAYDARMERLDDFFETIERPL